SGATLVYAALVQAPPNTFTGALSLGFCPDLPGTKPWCRGGGLEASASTSPDGRGFTFAPAASVTAPWIVLHGLADRVCAEPAAESFVARVRGARLVPLPKVGHGFSVQRDWMPQLREAFATLRASPSPERAL